MRRYFRSNPFQLDLFVKRIRLGIRALLNLRSSARLLSCAGVEVVYRFQRKDLFFFSCHGHLFSATAEQAAYLEVSPC